MALAASRPKSPRPYTGPLPEQVWEVVTVAWEANIATSGNFAREYAPYVALAASLGWISSVSLEGSEYLRHWNVTAEGVHALQHSRKLNG